MYAIVYLFLTPRSGCQVGGLKLTMVGVFSPQKMANTANQAFCPPRKPAVKHLPGHPWNPHADHRLLPLQFSLSPAKYYSSITF